MAKFRSNKPYKLWLWLILLMLVAVLWTLSLIAHFTGIDKHIFSVLSRSLKFIEQHWQEIAANLAASLIWWVLAIVASFLLFVYRKVLVSFFSHARRPGADNLTGAPELEVAGKIKTKVILERIPFELEIMIHNCSTAQAFKFRLSLSVNPPVRILRGSSVWSTTKINGGQTLTIEFRLVSDQDGNFPINYNIEYSDSSHKKSKLTSLSLLTLSVEKPTPPILSFRRDLITKRNERFSGNTLHVKTREPFMEQVELSNSGSLPAEDCFIELIEPIEEIFVIEIEQPVAVQGKSTRTIRISYKGMTEGTFSLPELIIRYRDQDGFERSQSLSSDVKVEFRINFEPAEFVNRDKELKELDALLDEALLGQSKFLLIWGDAGIGKTRLVSEFIRRALPKRVHVIEGRYDERDQVIPYQIFRILIGRIFGIRPGERGEVAKRKINENVKGWLGWGNQDVSFFMDFLTLGDEEPTTKGITSTGLVREKVELFDRIIGAFYQMVQVSPLLVIMEDLHWADSASVELLESLIVRLRKDHESIVICATARSFEKRQNESLSEALARLNAGMDFISNYYLDAFGLEDSYKIIDQIMAGLTTAEKHAIYMRAQGVPFYVQQLLNLLYSQGEIQRIGNKWHILPDVNLDNVLPVEVDKLLKRRLDLLKEEDLMILKCAAVVGQYFSPAVVEEALGMAVDRELDKLESDGLIHCISGTFESQLVYEFSHGLLRDTVYRAMGRNEARDLNGIVGVAIEKIAIGRLESVAEDLVHHYQLAGNADKTIRFAKLVGDRAANLFAYYEALAYYGVAVGAIKTHSHPDEYESILLDILCKRILIYIEQGEHNRALSDIQVLLPAAERAGDHKTQGMCYAKLSEIYFRESKYVDALHVVQMAAEQCKQAGWNEGLVKVELIWGEILEYLGQLVNAREHYLQALQISEQINWIPGKAESLAYIGSTDWLLGYYEKGMSALRQSYHLAHEIGQKSLIYYIARWIGEVYLDRLELTQACQFLKESQECAKDLGILDITTLYYLGIYHIRAGNLQEANRCFEEILSMRGRYEEPDTTGQTLCYIGKILQLGGNYPLAEQHCREGLSIVRQGGSKLALVESLGVVGEVFMGIQLYNEARELFQEQLVLSKAIQTKIYEVIACFNLARFHLEMKETQKTKYYFDLAVELSSSIQADEFIHFIQRQLAGY